MTHDEEQWQDDDEQTDEDREAEIAMYKLFPYVTNEEGCFYCGSHWHETVDCDDL